MYKINEGFYYKNKYYSKYQFDEFIEQNVNLKYYRIKIWYSQYYIECKRCKDKHRLFFYKDLKLQIDLPRCMECEIMLNNIFIRNNLSFEGIDIDENIDSILKDRINNIKKCRQSEGNPQPMKLCKEKVYSKFIQDYFKSEKFLYQLRVYENKDLNKYYIVDLFMPNVNIVIECDEYGHRDRNKYLESKREQIIVNKLNCHLVRFNPDDEKFTIKNVIAQIQTIISSNKQQQFAV